MSQPKVLLWKDKQALYDVPLCDVSEIDCTMSDPTFDYYPFGLVRLKYGTPQGHWFVVKVDEVAKCFPKRWRPA